MNSSADQNDVIAVERHSNRRWSLILLPAVIGPAISVALYPTGPARFVLILVGLLALPALALMWGGFQYRFLRHGVEVRTLGFSLRSIPKQAIVSYAIEPWTMARGGYGIRAMGTTRAYVWGNKVVHIKTTTGDVLLGHDDPTKIVRDLDQVTGLNTHGHMKVAIAHEVSASEAVNGGGMARTWYRILVVLMWLVLPTSAWNYWHVWDQLPARMAVHFDANWQPNGYTSREGALQLGLGIMVVMLVLFTVAALGIHALKPPAAWPALVISYVVLGVCWYANYSIVNFNLNAQHGQGNSSVVSPQFSLPEHVLLPPRADS